MGKKLRFQSAPRDCTQIMWLHKLPTLYTRLSVNVIRDLCSFFSVSQAKLVLLAYSKVLYFDTESRKGEMLFPLVNPVRTTLGFGYVWLSDTQVFACGPQGKTLLLTPNGNHTRSSLHHHRTQHGLVYSPQRHSVYVFGGLDRGFFGLHRRRSCERHDLITNKWTLLPKMTEHRKDFQPCLYRHYIVICGGCASGKFEAFDLETETYTEISNFAIAPGPAIVVNAEDYMITYCLTGLVKWRFVGEGCREVEVVAIAPAGSAGVETQTQPLHSSGATYFVYQGEFFRIAERAANRAPMQLNPRQKNIKLMPARAGS